jgi:two-component system LytT family response regulator
MFTVLVVDDEIPARELLLDLLADDAAVAAVLEAGDGEAAVRKIRSEQPDLVFLDVQMPGLTGLEVVEAVGADAMPITVFITAYDQHAIKAFDANAIDYLLKPFTDERFGIMMARVKQKLHDVQARQPRRQHPPVASPRVDDNPFLDRFAIKSDGSIRLMRVEDVLWIEAAGVYVTLNSASEAILYRAPLQEIERTLDPNRFLRVHRAIILNIDNLVQLKMRSHGEFEAILDNGTSLRVSRTYREALERRLKQKL